MEIGLIIEIIFKKRQRTGKRMISMIMIKNNLGNVKIKTIIRKRLIKKILNLIINNQINKKNLKMIYIL